jgi:CHASE3 domain sensor protein
MAQFSDSATARNNGHFGPPLPPWPLAGFAAAIVAVLVIALLSYSSLESREANVNQVTQSIGIVNQVQLMLSALKDAETGQRGYLLTGDPKYRTPYTNTRTSLEAIFRDARALIHNERRAQQFDTVEKLATAKMAELAATIELRDAGQSAEALELVRTDRGKLLMEDIRRTSDEMPSATCAERPR